MVLFWKKGESTSGDGIKHREAFLDRVLNSGSELMTIVGPEDGSCVCGDWVGAVVSVTGKDQHWPSLMDALEDGVFHEGCHHRLDTYAPEGNVEAEFCTQLAIDAMRKRRETSQDDDDESPIHPQIEFARLYDAAQQADASGATESALAKCEAALAMLIESDLFGEEQVNVEQVLEARIRAIIRSKNNVD